jgi:hypothetical protein
MGEVISRAGRSLLLESGGRLEEWTSCPRMGVVGAVFEGDCLDFDFEPRRGVARRFSELGVLSERMALGGLRGGVVSSSSHSSGMTLAVSETLALVMGVLAAVETFDDSAPSALFRRSTTRFLRLRIWFARPRPEPKLRPVSAVLLDTSDGRELSVSFPVLSDMTSLPTSGCQM